MKVHFIDYYTFVVVVANRGIKIDVSVMQLIRLYQSINLQFSP